MSFDSPNPYASSSPPATPKKSNVLFYILGGIGALFLLVCCGCGGFMYYGINTGMKQIGTAVRAQLQADPAVQEHIGNLQSCEGEISSLYSELKKDPKRHEGRNMAVRVKGDKGEGVVIGRFDQTGKDTGRFENAELIKSTGESYPITK